MHVFHLYMIQHGRNRETKTSKHLSHHIDFELKTITVSSYLD